MQTFLLTYAPWLTVFHVIAVIAWMAAQLYLPRLFVYHVGAEKGGELSETFKLMERRLLKAIMTPAMIATLIFGVLLLWAKPSLTVQLWFHIKMLAVVILLVTHGLCARLVRVFAEDRNHRSAAFYRILNEVPTFALILAVICVIAVRTYPAFL